MQCKHEHIQKFHLIADSIQFKIIIFVVKWLWIGSKIETHWTLSSSSAPCRQSLMSFILIGIDRTFAVSHNSCDTMLMFVCRLPEFFSSHFSLRLFSHFDQNASLLPIYFGIFECLVSMECKQKHNFFLFIRWPFVHSHLTTWCVDANDKLHNNAHIVMNFVYKHCSLVPCSSKSTFSTTKEEAKL